MVQSINKIKQYIIYYYSEMSMKLIDGAIKKMLFKVFIRNIKNNYDIFTYIKKFDIIKNKLLPLDDNEIDNMFEDLSKYIQNKTVISKINKLLNKYYKWLYYGSSQKEYEKIAHKIDSKKFLSCFMIYYFPRYLLNTDYSLSENIIDKHLIDISFDLIKSIEIVEVKPNIFVKSLNKYINCLNEFLINDRVIKIRELVEKWTDLEKTIKQVNNNDRYEDKNEIINVLKNEQHKTIKYIKIIDINFNIDQLNEFFKLNELIEATMIKCYFDNLENDIIECKYVKLKEILTDIKNNLILLYKKNETELDEYFDIDFIIQQLEHGVFKFEDYIGLVDYCINMIVKLQAPFRNNTTLNTWTNIKNKSNKQMESIEWTLENAKQLYSSIYAKTACSSIKLILDDIIDIKNDIINFIIRYETS